MVRRCIVPNCNNTDATIVSHRFPKNTQQAKQWADSLDLQDIDPNELDKYMVCTLHFNEEDYRNKLSNRLNATALPHRMAINPRTPGVLGRNIPIISIDQHGTSEFHDQHSVVIPNNAVCEVVITYDEEDGLDVEVDAEQDGLNQFVPITYNKVRRTARRRVSDASSTFEENPVNAYTYKNDDFKRSAPAHLVHSKAQDLERIPPKPVMKDFTIQAEMEDQNLAKEDPEYRGLKREQLIQELKRCKEEIEALKTKLSRYEHANEEFLTYINKYKSNIEQLK